MRLKAYGAGRIYFEAEGAAGGAGAPAAGAPAAGAPAAGAPAAGAPAAGAPAGTWYETAQVDTQHHDWLRSKGYDGLNTALASHRHLESLLGRNRLPIPTGPEDTAAYDAIYNATGRPQTADKYALPQGIEFQDDNWKQLLPALHKAGLSQAGFEQVSAEYHRIGVEAQQRAETERANVEAAQIAELEREWGSAKTANEDLASRAFRSLGLDASVLDKIESAIGYRDTMKLFHGVGRGMSEDQLAPPTGGGTPGAATSVEAAKAKVQALLADKDFIQRYQSPNQGIRNKAIEEMEYWQKLANPEIKR